MMLPFHGMLEGILLTCSSFCMQDLPADFGPEVGGAACQSLQHCVARTIQHMLHANRCLTSKDDIVYLLHAHAGTR